MESSQTNRRPSGVFLLAARCLALLFLLASCARPGSAKQGDAGQVDPGQGDAGQGDVPQPQALPSPPPAPALTPKEDLPSCGDKDVMARFAACKEAAVKFEQAACEAAGGHWGRHGLHMGCTCPTGQVGCKCTKADDCLGKCVIGGRDCPEEPSKAEWHCSSSHDVVGCYCHMLGYGGTLAVCAD